MEEPTIQYVFLYFRYRRENNRLTSDQSRLQATYREIENQSKFLSEKIARQQVSRGLNACFSVAILCVVQSIACAVFRTADNAARQDRKGNNREKTHRRSGKQDGALTHLTLFIEMRVGFLLLLKATVCCFPATISCQRQCVAAFFRENVLHSFSRRSVPSRVFPPVCAIPRFPASMCLPRFSAIREF